jgi:transposase
MIDYATWARIHTLHKEQGLRPGQIARELGLHRKTVQHWLKRSSYHARKPARRKSKLDPYKGQIVRLLERHPYTAAQVLSQLREQGYPGGYSILKEFIAQVRPPKQAAFLTLHFEPGETAQVDWGHAGTIAVGNTRRRMSFFVMVLCYSRMMYVEFTLSQKHEHFLACHRNAFEAFGGVPKKIMIDNLKSAVLSHPPGGPVHYHPRYLDLAEHYGFEPRACNVRAANEKGRVERAVSYVRSSFLRGLSLDQFAPVNPAARQWLDTVANVRDHGQTRERPIDRFNQAERKALQSLPAAPYDVGLALPVTASSQFRITLDTNRYSVPAEYAGRRLTLRLYPDRLIIYHEHQLVAEHARSYDRRGDFLIEDHQRALLQQRRRARDQQALSRLFRATPLAEAFVHGLESRRLNPTHHIRKIDALAEIYGEDELRRAIQDAVELEAFSAEYLANLLEQRARKLPEPGALHLTRSEDLLDLELPAPDLSIYDPPEPPENDHE